MLIRLMTRNNNSRNSTLKYWIASSFHVFLFLLSLPSSSSFTITSSSVSPLYYASSLRSTFTTTPTPIATSLSSPPPSSEITNTASPFPTQLTRSERMASRRESKRSKAAMSPKPPPPTLAKIIPTMSKRNKKKLANAQGRGITIHNDDDDNDDDHEYKGEKSIYKELAERRMREEIEKWGLFESVETLADDDDEEAEEEIVKERESEDEEITSANPFTPLRQTLKSLLTSKTSLKARIQTYTSLLSLPSSRDVIINDAGCLSFVAVIGLGLKSQIRTSGTSSASHLSVLDNVIKDCMSMRNSLMQTQHVFEAKDTLGLIKALVRSGDTIQAEKILELELSMSTFEQLDYLSSLSNSKAHCRAMALAVLCSRYFDDYNVDAAVLTTRRLSALGPVVKGLTNANRGDDATLVNVPWLKVILSASRFESRKRDNLKLPLQQQQHIEQTNDATFLSVLSSIPNPTNITPYKTPIKSNSMYNVVNAMTSFPSTNTNETYESLANSLVRRVHFVTGAVSMSTLPAADRNEVAFIGRSNVGKSSLVNMICNRKALAYTSKTPGKTQQFNYFAVNDKVDAVREIKYGDAVTGEKDDDSFYFVDLPGFGYAKVPVEKKEQWGLFMKEYFERRRRLKVIFHLVDSRHGVVSEDVRIMEECAEVLKCAKDKVRNRGKVRDISYVMVLTKADKNNTGKSSGGSGKVAESVVKSVRDMMDECGLEKCPVVLSSAETKLGRDEIWRFLQRVHRVENVEEERIGYDMIEERIRGRVGQRQS